MMSSQRNRGEPSKFVGAVDFILSPAASACVERAGHRRPRARYRYARHFTNRRRGVALAASVALRSASDRPLGFTDLLPYKNVTIIMRLAVPAVSPAFMAAAPAGPGDAFSDCFTRTTTHNRGEISTIISICFNICWHNVQFGRCVQGAAFDSCAGTNGWLLIK